MGSQDDGEERRLIFQVRRLATSKWQLTLWREHIGLHDRRVAFKRRECGIVHWKNILPVCFTIPSRHTGSTCLHTRLCFKYCIDHIMIPPRNVGSIRVHTRPVRGSRCGVICCTQSAYVHMMCLQPAGVEFQSGLYQAMGQFCFELGREGTCQ